jgi:hypothetical protein
MPAFFLFGPVLVLAMTTETKVKHLFPKQVRPGAPMRSMAGGAFLLLDRRVDNGRAFKPLGKIGMAAQTDILGLIPQQGPVVASVRGMTSSAGPKRYRSMPKGLCKHFPGMAWHTEGALVLRVCSGFDQRGPCGPVHLVTGKAIPLDNRYMRMRWKGKRLMAGKAQIRPLGHQDKIITRAVRVVLPALLMTG